MAEYLNFKVGADTGILLANLAQEHFLYEHDLNKALNVFNQSFGGGCPQPMQLRLLRGDLVVEVDEAEQMFLVAEREAKHDHLYPKLLDFKAYFEQKQEQLDKHAKELKESLDTLIRAFRYHDTQWLEFSSEAIIQFIYQGKDDAIIDEIHENSELNSKAMLIKVIKEFIEKSLKLEEAAKQLHGLYPELKIEFDTYEVWLLMQKLQALGNLNLNLIPEDAEFQEVTNYLDAVNKIDEVIKSGIEPVDIMDNYSAGWLSPKGIFYGLNGEIANMLHQQISDALQQTGLIPSHENDDTDLREINPDAWLEQQGWVKIHGNNINFGGCLNVKLGKPNVNMTDTQIEMIMDYINNHHQCIIKAGWRLTRESVNRFAMLAKSDPIACNKKYFTFD